MSSPLRLLLVEDSESDAAIVVRRLEKSGYAVEHLRVESGDELRRALADKGWDLVLCDNSLPQLDAPAALALFQQSGVDIPFLVVSGEIGEEAAVAMMKAGAQDVLMKGNLRRLAPAVARELGEARNRRERRRAEAAVREKEQQVRDLVEHTHAIICSHDLDGRILSINPWAARLLGRSRQEVLQMNLRDVLIPETRDQLDAYLEEIRREGAASGLMAVQTKTGERRIWEYHNNLRDSETPHPVVVGVGQDVTEERAADARQARHAEIMTLIAKDAPLPSILEAIVRKVEADSPVSLCSVLLLDEQGTHLLFGAAPSLPGFYKDAVDGLAIGPEVCASSAAAYSGERVIVEDIRNDPRWAPYREVAARAELAACWSEPIHGGDGKVLGTFAIYHREPRAPSSDDIAAITAAGQLAAIAIERTQVVQALAHKETQLRTVLESLPIGVWVIEANGKIVLGNDAVQRIWAGARYVGIEQYGEYKGWWADSGKRIEAEEWAAARAISRGETSLEEEIDIECFDGSRKTILNSALPLLDENQRITGAIVVNQDVTARNRASEALQESEQLNRRLVEHLPHHVFVKDRDSVYLACNANYARDRGLALAEVAGKTDFDFFDRELAESYRADDREVMTAEAMKSREERYIVNGQVRWARTVKLPYRDEQGRVAGVVGIFEDITEHRQLQEQLRQSLKMEAVGRLAGGVAHDFNNLLTVIGGYAEMGLASGLPPGDPLREGLLQINRASQRAASLTRQLLAFSRQQVLQPRSLDLNEVVAELSKMMRRTIGENIELVTELDGSLGRVHADPGQIEQILLNLVVNARDAMPRGGRVSIETADVVVDNPFATNHGMQPGPWVRLNVSDTGCGMDSATEQRIFEPFFTTKEKGQGTGLGLSTVYGIVKQSGGFIWVESAPGDGTTFSLYFPPFLAEEVREAPPTTPFPAPRGAETVLLVEDDRSLRRLVARMLTGHGYRVLKAGDPEEALAVSAAHDGPIELLLTDLVMPRGGGLELAAQIAEARPATRVLCMSGYADRETLAGGSLGSEVPFLAKPFSSVELAKKVREVLTDEG